VLEHHLNATSILGSRHLAIEQLPVEVDGAGRGFLETDDDPTERRLSATGLSNESECLSPIDLEIDTAHGRGERATVAETLVEVANFKQSQARSPSDARNMR
jgi:hypothetical protein